MRPRRRFKSWLIILLTVIIAHVLFITFFQPEYLEVFERKNIGKSSRGASSSKRYFEEDRFVVVNTYHNEEANPDKKPIVKIDKKKSEKTPAFDYNIPPIDFSLNNAVKGNKGDEPGSGKETNPRIKPSPILIPWPEYPEGVDKDFNGQVILNLYVSKEGKVMEVELLEGLSTEGFNRKAVQAARKMRFTPGLVNGQPEAMWLKITIKFQPR
ncbi:MAG: TonB family protein [Candidatus Krumholzibacteriota bacterium]|nr:TonB family protein [Candidatus Krumholzibacteriota bacterium]